MKLELNYNILIFGFVASNTFFLMNLPGQAAKILAMTLVVWTIGLVAPTFEEVWHKVFKIEKKAAA